MPNLLIQNVKHTSLTFSESSLLVIFVFILFLADASVVVLSASNVDFYRVSLILRTLLEFYIIGYLINDRTGVSGRKSLMMVLALLSIVTTGVSCFVISGNKIDFVETFVAFNKFTFIFLAYPFMEAVFKKSQLSFLRLCKIYELIIYLNSAAIFSGLLFNLSLFRSYVQTSSDHRFGYKGFIFAQNEASLFYLIALFYAIYLFHTKRKSVLLVTVLLSNSLLGTKAGLIFPILIVFSYWLLIRKSLTTKAIALSSIVAIVLYFYLTDIESIMMTFPILRYFHYFYTQSDLWTMLFSNRNIFIDDRFWPIVNNWTWVNWLFGGTNINTNAIEMDFHDTFLLMGLVGSIIYIWGYLRLFITHDNILFTAYFAFFYFLVAALGGHVFYSSMNALYLCILLLKLRENTLYKPSVLAAAQI